MATYTPLPTIPVPGSETFNEDAGVLLDALPLFGTEVKAMADEVLSVNTASAASATASAASATASGASATAAAISATAAASSANFKGNWSALTGALDAPASILHNGQIWQLTANLANVTTATPGTSASWYPVVNIDVASRAPIQPTLDLDFANQRYRVYDGAVGLKEIALADILTYTGSARTYTDAMGILRAQSSNVPRLTFDPVTGVGNGLSVWGATANLLLNSLFDGTPLATQSVTLTAVEHRLSFCGTGTVTLSGAANGSSTGAAAYPTRTGLTFTPTAGSVTFTVTGSVQFAMLTTGNTDSPFIPTSAAAVTAPADVASITGSNFSKWFNAVEGTFVVQMTQQDLVNGQHNGLVVGSNGTLFYTLTSSSTMRFYDGTTAISVGSITSAAFKAAYAYGNNLQFASLNGAANVSSAFDGALGSDLSVGGSSGNNNLNGTIARILYFPRALPSSLQALSA